MGATEDDISPQPMSLPSNTQEDEDALPPWKRKGRKPKSLKVDPIDNVEIKVPDTNVEMTSLPKPKQLPEPALMPSSVDGFQTSQPKTFTGDRGGSAEDDELLAELRAISAKSGSSNRFQEEGNVAEDDWI